jgi:FkbM family methyltransferase
MSRVAASAVIALVLGLAGGFGAGRVTAHPQAAPEKPATTTVVSETERELKPFRAKYGPGHNSEQQEEWFIRDFFHDRRGGTFVDVGANHYRNSSKTYYLETALGWSGIAIEPQREFAAGYAEHRPRTKFLPFFVSDASNRTAQLYVLKRLSVVSSSDRQFVSGFGTPDEVRDVPTITLDDALKAERIEHPDFMSIDIELHEPQALRGFDIDRHRPSLVCIEGLPPVRQEILDYFARHRYVLVGKYVWVDLMNFYFAPLDPEPPGAR